MEFKIQYLDTPGYILADGGRLYNVFDNLITNAIKYSMENTRVYIQIERMDDQICISFKNIANYELKFDPGSLTERLSAAMYPAPPRAPDWDWRLRKLS